MGVRVLTLFVFLLALPGAASGASGHAAVGALFSENVLAANGREFLRKAATLSADERLVQFREWVFPTEHRGFRLRGWFSETDRRPHAIAQQMVAEASELGQLQSLSMQVSQINAATSADQRAKAALLAMIAIAAQNYDLLAVHLNLLVDMAAANPQHPLQNRWPEVLVAEAARSIRDVRPVDPAVEELLVTLRPKARADNHSVEAAHVLSLLAHFQMAREAGRVIGDKELLNAASIPKGAADANAAKKSARWVAVDRVDDVSESVGRPHGKWWLRDHTATCVSTHYCESLYWSVPLRGDFQIEAEVSSVPYSRGHFAWGGRWVAVPNTDHMQSGRFWTGTKRTDIQPPLTDMDAWSRYRLRVRNRTVSVWLNGKRIEQHNVAPDADPWLSVRNMWLQNSSVRNVRVTGHPDIPTEVSLLTADDLPAWSAYSSVNNWKQVRLGNETAPVELRSFYRENLTGTSAESLLYYHRPMMEDGEIEYEFFYRPDEVHVHPAIGDTVLLVEPDGVRPRQLQPMRSSDDGTVRLPVLLRANEWNHARLSLVADTMSVAVNDITVASEKLPVEGRRNFGLFHFADQTGVRVRNIKWRGDWPRQLPELSNQQLAAPDHECLEGLDELTEVMVHDFAVQGIPESKFRVDGHSLQTTVRETASGVQVSPMADGNWRGIWIKLKEPVYGDFDATLTFEQLDFVYGKSDYLDMELRGIDASGREMKATRQMHKTDDSFWAKMDVMMPDGSWVGDSEQLRDQSTAGRLRLVRRGDTCHMLIAHEDSPNFHYCGSRQLFSTDSVMRLEVLAKCAGGGSTSVLLKKLEVRSNSAAEAARRDLRVAGLDEFAYSLRRRKIHSFSRIAADEFTVTGDHAVGTKGLVATVPVGSSGRPKVAMATFTPTMTGNFDVAVSVDIDALQPGGSAALIFANGDADTAEIRITCGEERQVRITGDATTNGDPASVQTNGQVGELRLIRVQKTFFLIYSLEGNSRLLSHYDLSNTPGQITLQLQNVGDVPSQVTWKSFRYRVAE